MPISRTPIGHPDLMVDISGFSGSVRLEELDGSALGDGWGMFIRSWDAEIDEPIAWQGYVEITVGDGDPVAARLETTKPFRVRSSNAPDLDILVSRLVKADNRGRACVLVIENSGS